MADHENADVKDAELPWWMPIWEFFVHAVAGTILFLLIALPAIGIDLFLHYSQTHLSLDLFVVIALTLAEYSILLVDLILFFIFLSRSVARAIREF